MSSIAILFGLAGNTPLRCALIVVSAVPQDVPELEVVEHLGRETCRSEVESVWRVLRQVRVDESLDEEEPVAALVALGSSSGAKHEPSESVVLRRGERTATTTSPTSCATRLVDTPGGVRLQHETCIGGIAWLTRVAVRRGVRKDEESSERI